MIKIRRISFFFALIALLAVTAAPVLNAQARLNDRDVQALLKNLRDDAKAFRGPFDSSLRRSPIRGTGQEKDAKRLAEIYARQTDDLWKHFKDKKRASGEVQAVVDMTGRLDRTVYSQNLGPATTNAWQKVRADVHLIAQAWGITEPYYQNSARQ